MACFDLASGQNKRPQRGAEAEVTGRKPSIIRRSRHSLLDSKSGLIWKTEWPNSASTDRSDVLRRKPIPDIEHIRSEIERMRTQVMRQRGDIRQLHRAGISTAGAESLLDRMLSKIDDLCAERDRLKKEQPTTKGRALGGRSW